MLCDKILLVSETLCSVGRLRLVVPFELCPNGKRLGLDFAA